MSMFDLEEDKLLAEITERGARRILIQLPDGLKNEGTRLAGLVREKTGADVFVSAVPAWGACDLSVDAATRLRADLLVHYGHNEFLRDSSNGVPVVYIPAKSNHDITPVVERAVSLLQGKTVGLATTIQHLHKVSEAAKFLEAKGFNVQTPGRGPWAHETGQVLGCDYFGLRRIQCQVDSFLIVGSYFHGLGAALSVEKSTILADPYDGAVKVLSQDRATHRLRSQFSSRSRRQARKLWSFTRMRLCHRNYSTSPISTSSLILPVPALRSTILRGFQNRSSQETRSWLSSELGLGSSFWSGDWSAYNW